MIKLVRFLYLVKPTTLSGIFGMVYISSKVQYPEGLYRNCKDINLPE